MGARLDPRQHADTEAPLEGLEARLQRGFDWIGRHPRAVLAALGAIVALGALTAVSYELWQRSRDESAAMLAEIEDRFATSMGGAEELAFVPEPANPEQAARSREEALRALEAFVGRHARSRASYLAQLRAAEIESDLGRHAEAEARLRDLTKELGDDDPLRAVALRLLGYVLEEQERPADAGQAYADAAAVESYPDHAALWLAAGEAFRRAGDRARAEEAYREVIRADPEFAAERGVEGLLALLAIGADAPAEGS
jgi:predicted negative regulator of RcsB-dependent stress response